MSWLSKTIESADHAERLRTDLPYFCEHALKLRPKAGLIEPFSLNHAQRVLHELIEDQKKKTGKVRVIVLKARQLGVSTYVAARLFHKTINSPGLRTFIVGHEKRASSNLFGIVRRFYDLMPENLKPAVGTSNVEELVFSSIDAGYLVSVASSDSTGRSATAQQLHASEVAFWNDLDVQMAALFQTVPDLPGTEILLESTANGYNAFHALWQKAIRGESEFLPVFLPWWLDTQYQTNVGPDWSPDSEERQLMMTYKLSREQMAWRRNKISQLGNEHYFNQEYPHDAASAFISSDFDAYIPPVLVLAARAEELEDPYGDLVIGVDPAGMGPDRTSIAWRRGHAILKVESRRGLTTMEVAGWVAHIIRKDEPDQVNIDVGGLGVGVYDRLREQGYSVNAINFGGRPIEPSPVGEDGRPGGGCANRRSEMWQNLKRALEAGRFSLPDRDSLQSDLVSTGYRFDSAGRLLLESKHDMRKRGVGSPDEADAVALCFASPEGHQRVRNWNKPIQYPRGYGSY